MPKITVYYSCYLKVGAAWLFSLVAGPFCERFGRKPTILLASVVFTAGSIVMGVALSKEVAILLGALSICDAVVCGYCDIDTPMGSEDFQYKEVLFRQQKTVTVADFHSNRCSYNRTAVGLKLQTRSSTLILLYKGWPIRDD